MPFESILQKLVNQADGAVGAMLLDWEGESVEVVGVDIPEDELRLVGAYQAVFLDRLNKVCSETSVGQPEKFEVSLEESIFLNWVLHDGYYVVLVLRPDVPRGVAWYQLGRCRLRLLEEM